MRISPALLAAIVEHARRDAPDECCGVVGVRDGTAVSVHALENLAHSPYRFEAGAELVGVMEELDDAGVELGAIYHSHTRTEPVPSQTDINFSRAWPGTEWVIVGLGTPEPVVRSFLIEDGRVRETELVVA